tara:strand:+ start:3331 stop:3618 length:288 start_codon:yes stop_codon:yes gene_type:complete
MTKKYVNMFPGDDLKNAMSSFGKKPLGKSHSQGFTPKEDIVLKAGQTYSLTLWSGTTQNGHPSLSLAIEDWQPFTGGSSNNAEGTAAPSNDDAPF